MSGIRISVVAALLFGLAASPVPSPAGNVEGESRKTAALYLLRSSVMGAAGSPGESTQFLLNGTMGQPSPVGSGSSANFILVGGFWNRIQTSTSVLDGLVPDFFKNALLPNRPNPFNPITTILYEVKRTSPVDITIYNIQGRLVRSLVQEVKSPGRYEFTWDGRNDQGRSLSSGIFFCHFQVGTFSDVRKMLLLK